MHNTSVDEELKEFLEDLMSGIEIEAKQQLARVLDRARFDLKSSINEVQIQTVESVFLAVHTLRGTVRVSDHSNLEVVCVPLEKMFGALRQGDLACTPQLLEIAVRSATEIQKIVASPPDASLSVEQVALVQELRQMTLNSRCC